MVSYNREQASGLEHLNIVTVVINQFNLSRDDAVQWLLKRIAELETQYQSLVERVRALAPSFGPEVALVLPGYLEHTSNMRRAAWCWSFECGRYFGEHGAEFAAAKQMPLVPKRNRRDLHQNQVEVLDMQEELAKCL